MKFEWDEDKAAKNLRKHGVTFQEASTVFYDRLAQVSPDEMHSERMTLIGMSQHERLLFTVYVEKEELDDGETIYRIISARRATSHERKGYEEGK